MRGCLIGQNVQYSYSKKIHEALGSSYDLISLKENELDDFFKDLNYDFVNVTIPYKEKVLKYLDVISKDVETIGACNLIKRENGKLIGLNSDYLGFIDSLKYHNIDLNNKKVLILGTGGAEKAISYALKKYNTQIDKASRSGKGLSYEFINNQDNYYDIVINTTPNGMYPNITDDLLINLDKFKNLKVVIDIIYNPRRTKLLIEAEKTGTLAINGISMLVYQALVPYNNLYPNSALKLIELLNNEANIVLIGMPYAGKSYLGRKLTSRSPERDLYDIDDIITKRFGNIEDIFKEKGENYFRDIEEEVIKEISLKKDAIIVTGGGFFKRSNNINLLKANGTLFYLNRTIDELLHNYDIAKLHNRPLILNKDDLIKLYKERHNIYLDIMDEEYR